MTQVVAIPKYSAEDTSLPIGNEAGETIMAAIPAGSWITIDAVGLHYNRKITSHSEPIQVVYRELHSAVLG